MMVNPTQWKSTFVALGYDLFHEVLAEIPTFDFLLTPGVEKVYEQDGITLRSIYGFHENPTFLDWLNQQHIIKEIVTEIIGEEVYIHQSKVNLKNQQESSVWPFHRDFPFWNVFDHFSHNHFLNVVIYLDDVVEDSGALELIPKSHLEFLAREKADKDIDYSLEGSAGSDLLFRFSETEIAYFKEKYGTFTTVGKKGSILLFNPDIIHGSGNSTLDFSRKIMILTFNTCANKPDAVSPRPNYLCNQNQSPLPW